MSDDDAVDTPAGVPNAAAEERRHWIMAGAIGIPLVGGILYLALGSLLSTTFATTIGSVPVAELGVPVQQPMQIAPGTQLTFALSTGYTYSGNVDVMLAVELLRAGAKVANTECNMKSLGGMGGGVGSGSNTWYGDAGWTCKLEAPDGGVDAIRVAVDKRGRGSLTIRKPAVLVKRR